MDLSVVILNWNTRDLLQQALRSLACPQPGLEFEVIVVDNNSEDDSIEMVRSHFPNVRLVTSQHNTGFGAGNNLAIPHARGRYILFLNSDTVILDDALAAMVRYADSNPNIGILGPKLINGDGSLQYSCRRYPNLGTGFFRNTPLGRLFPNNKFTTDYLYQDWDHNTPRDVDWVSGAALMMRRTLLDAIGGFDEDYFMYCEDVDLCWRVNHTVYSPLPDLKEGAEKREAGSKGLWRVTYCPEARITHLIGRSSDKVPTRMTYEFHRSQYLFYKKHYAAVTPLLLRPLIPPGIALRAVGQMIRYRVRYWQRYLRGEFRKPKQTGSETGQGGSHE